MISMKYSTNIKEIQARPNPCQARIVSVSIVQMGIAGRFAGLILTLDPRPGL